ncbi:MAG TPA: sigma-70 family RNA polymerase sigma factor [Marmoricola sp.]|nr:sigma-70 family RNA polymerase sigma factor [Marmoricola sp.]
MTDELEAAFEANRTHLISVAQRILGSRHEAEDVVQEAWLRMNRSDTADIANPAGWLTTVVSRMCLDQLRAKTARREDFTETPLRVVADPADQAELADAVGGALLVVLDTLSPAERLAFVLHDLFAVEFTEIATILDRGEAAARQLASRARRKIQGQDVATDQARQRAVVDAFLDASRNGNFETLMSLLHPDASVSANAAAIAMGTPAHIDGRDAVAEFFNGRAKGVRFADIDGYAGGAWTLKGELKVLFAFTVEDGLVREIEFLSGDFDEISVEYRKVR